MKTSTLLITIAILLTLGCLTAFNIDMKKTYLSGNYKNRFKNMEFIPFSGVEKLRLRDADIIGIKVEKGNKEGIWIDNHLEGEVTLKVIADELLLGLSDKGKVTKSFSYTNEIIIVTRELKNLSAEPSAKKDEDKHYGKTQITVSGYQSAALNLEIGSGVGISLQEMNLSLLKAVIGDKNTGNAELTLSSDTKIDSAMFTIPGAGKLTLMDPKILKTSYNLSDQASITLSGKLVHLVK